MTPELVIRAIDIHKHFVQGEQNLHILRGVNLEVSEGERIAIIGLSGSGKSTLLHMLGGLDTCEEGRIEINGSGLVGLSENELCQLRNKSLGFIYQFHHLMMDFTAVENVMMPLRIGGMAVSEAKDKAGQLLVRVGLGDRLDHRPGQLSGGERQRVAIARALVTRPQCILADEPTGNLDEDTALEIDELMMELSDEFNISFVIVTHNLSLASRMDRMLELHNGVLA
ncbi:MAG: lipoprotein-releasing system ATP-binding protein [Candidatus Azotimanducaceae bacterium]|jgi:lipoprotein-releasing system ATP-binding protein